LEKIRTFIAIEVPEEVKEKINSLQERLTEGPYRKKPKNIHLTLKFLGNIDADRIDSLGKALETACKNIGPFIVTVEGLGAFPNLKTPRVLWVGIVGSAELTHLYRNNIKSDLKETFSTDEFILFKSKLSPKGAEYSPLKRIRLKDGLR
jgi:2'-5' RNA ligase